jgi:dienelactone hydrolase
LEVKNMKFLSLFIIGIMSLGFSQPAPKPTLKTKSIEYQHGDVKLEGYLAYDASHTEKRPGVLIIHEWWGHNEYAQMRARQLAELGYIAFALDMYGKGVLAKDAQKASELAAEFYQDRRLMRERAAAGLAVLKDQNYADKEKIAAIGFCFGGTTALELARGGATINGVVSFHGGLNTPNSEDAKNIKASILVLHGADDPYVKKEEVEAFQQEMRNAGVDWQMIYYADAVHSFSNPASGNDKSSGAAYNERAAHRSWSAMNNFFEEIFQ